MMAVNSHNKTEAARLALHRLPGTQALLNIWAVTKKGSASSTYIFLIKNLAEKHQTKDIATGWYGSANAPCKWDGSKKPSEVILSYQ
jgi:hypothetical protein